MADGRPLSSEPVKEAIHPQVPLMASPWIIATCFFGWLLPGAGHIVLRSWGRGMVFMVAVITMFICGLSMEGKLYGSVPEQPLQFLAFIANIGIGIPYIFAHHFGYGEGMISAPNYDYGTTYLWVSGLLNYLIVLDAFEIGQGKKP